MVGTIPTSLGNLSNLQSLILYGNQLSGSIPAELGDLTNLQTLSLMYNQLSGSIPAELGNLSNLQYLGLYNNQLSGSLPTELGNLSNLQTLSLEYNQLSGSLPVELGNLSNLQTLSLRVNQLSGSIPAELGNLSNLQYLDLYINQLSGAIPVELGNLSNLLDLVLGEQLSGAIPAELGNLSNLQRLALGSNQLSGAIPAELGNLSNLQTLSLDFNQLSGSIPSELGNLSNLQTLALYDNQFEDLPDFSSLLSLRSLLVSRNKLTFEDIEPNIGVPGFRYQPQDSVGARTDTTVSVGDTLTLLIPVGGTANQYQWMKNGVDIPGAIDSSFTIDAVALEDSGSYSVRVTNTIATALTLYSRPIDLTVADEFILKRKLPDDTYEFYQVQKHAWQFGNTSGNMWPQSWWSQFDYSQPPYPPAWPFWPINARPQDFPDWALFVDAFGENQTYWDPPPGLIIYRPSAVLRWSQIKGDWGGSCFGFAVSSFLAFDDQAAFSNEFPNIGSFTDLHDLMIDDETRKVINQLWIYQFGDAQLAHIDANDQKTPNQTLTEIKQMFLSDTRDDQFIAFYNQSGSGGHVLNPYRIETDQNDPDIEYIYVYDSNFPDSDIQSVTINTANNTWDYPDMPNWGGSQGFFLMDPVLNYLSTPVLPKSVPPRERFLAQQSNYLKFFNTPNASITIKAPNGNTIGYSDSVAFNNLDDGVPIIPPTGSFHPPIGYYIPDAQYTITMQNFADSSAYLTVFTDSVVYNYGRPDPVATQTDYLTYGNSLAVGNHDSQMKEIRLEAIAIEDDNEKVFIIEKSELTQNDSLSFEIANRQDLQLLNFGPSKSYDLRAELASADEEVLFEYPDIVLPSNSSHLISPDWDSLKSQPVEIFVDDGMDGSIDDTLIVENLATVNYEFAQAGWYMVSLPVSPQDKNVNTLFPDAVSAFGWDYNTQNYVSVTELEPGKAYWLLMLQSASSIINGALLDTYSTSYTVQGWDMIGSVRDTSSLVDNPDGSVAAMFGWDGPSQSYVQINPMVAEPTEGYWILVINVPATVTLGDSTTASAASLAKAWTHADLAAFYQRFGALPPPPPSSVFSDQYSESSLPTEFGLSQNYPNPFNPETVIEYRLPEASRVSLKIYNILGKLIHTLVDGERPAGDHQVIWDGRDEVGLRVESGVYFVRMLAGEFSAVRKLILLK